ncbi:HAD-IA family hydrolase [Nocardioides sp. YIM 152315]|uniref:HAD family hydrolase n=1 Tax=Nocardioides sp. YIM 152315 TaxID=3031760 RepID=UPI0023DAF072|nr:HAD-IA family hydrolase [Nocardioides sp. YIM 152315]MDF1603577.1 HAD-IA family hydrolase [Nocardioides sp. YIM 152315]
MIRHLLLDADGVVQRIPGGWEEPARRLLGDRSPEILEELLVAELPALRGQGDFVPELRRAFQRHGIDGDADELYAALWNRIEVSDEVVELVRGLRGAGYGVHLATNQHRQRAAYMRTELGYDELFDVSCYSCELGLAKPEVAYFERAVAMIGADPGQVLFVDDSLPNVEGARSAGLAAEHWRLDDGLPSLLSVLARHGVEVEPDGG